MDKIFTPKVVLIALAVLLLSNIATGYFAWRNNSRIVQLVTVADGQQKVINEFLQGKLPAVKTQFRGQDATYPFPTSMMARFDMLVRELSKKASLSEELLFFPDKKNTNPFNVKSE